MIRKISEIFFLTFLLLVPGPWPLAPSPALAAKTTYIYTNRRFHFVKRVELDKKELKKRGEAGQPYSFTELQLRNLLADVQISEKLLFKKEVESQEVFNQSVLDFLVPHLVEAFKQAQPNEEIVFSFVATKAKSIAQDNRLTLGKAWVKDGFLHVYFRKLSAKIDTTNYDKLGDVSKAINRAKGLKIALQLKEGQEFGETTDEVLLSLAPKKDNEQRTMDKGPTVKKDQGQGTRDKGPTAKTEEAESTIETRLKKLKELKEKGLITEEEYEAKRKEILKEL